MLHDEAVLLLPELLDNELEPSTAARARQHVECCEQCRELQATYQLLVQASRLPSPQEHPSSRSLVAYASGVGALDPSIQRAVETHLAQCAECADDVAATREVLAHHERSAHRASMRRSLVSAAWRSPAWRATAAATVVFALLAIPAWRGIATREPGEPLATSATSLTLLTTVTRSSSSTLQQVRREPTVVLGIEPALPESLRDDTLLQLTLDSGWQQTLTAGTLRRAAEASGIAVIVIPRDELPLGVRILRLRAGQDVLLESRFEVVDSPPS
jgi:hypothetical protein